MATGISFNGVSTVTPGVLSKVDTNGLTQVGLTALGRVALLGTAVGGKPYTEAQSAADLTILTQPSQASQFRSGDLKEAAAIAFDPSNDAAIAGGASAVIAVKVNPSTQAQATLSGAQGPVVALKSLDYGAFTNSISVLVAKGTTQGLQVTVAADDVVESVNNLGSEGAFTLTYDGGNDGYATMQAGVDAQGALSADGTLTIKAGRSAVKAQPQAPGALGLTANDADRGLAVTVYGADADGAAQAVTFVAGMDAPQVVFSAVYGAAAWARSNKEALSVFEADSGTVLFTMAKGAQYVGVQPASHVYVAQRQVTLTAQGADAGQVLLVARGNERNAEAVTLATQDPTESLKTYADLAGFVTGALAQDVKLAAQAAHVDPAQVKSIGAVLGYFEGRQASVDNQLRGFIADAGTLSSTAPSAQFDSVLPTDCKAPKEAAFGDQLYSLVNWLNSNSNLVTASVPDGAQGVPEPMLSPVYLSGGTEGVATFADYQAALNLLQNLTVDTIVPLTCDPSVAAAVDAHCAFMNSPKGGNERSGMVGIAGADGTSLPSKKEALAQAQALSTRNLSAIPVGIVRFATDGTLKTFSPAFAAVAAAGMAAGGALGASLTRKFVKAQSMVNHRSWSPKLDADDMIQGGLLFTRLVDGQGFAWVRDVTTYLQATNLAYQERGVNYGCNYTVKRLRAAAEVIIGRAVNSVTTAALQSLLKGELDSLIADGVITTYQPPVVVPQGDKYEVQVSVAPTIPTNFVTLTLGVVPSPSTTAQAA